VDIGALSLDEVLITSAREFYTDPPDTIAERLRALADSRRLEDRPGVPHFRVREAFAVFTGSRRQSRTKESEPSRG
jgi:hypothetical protein